MTSRWLAFLHAIEMARIGKTDNGRRYLFGPLDLNADPFFYAMTPQGEKCVVERVEAEFEAGESRPTITLILAAVGKQFKRKADSSSIRLRNVG